MPEEVHTELHFLYSDPSQEVVSTDPKHHIGLSECLNPVSLPYEELVVYYSCSEVPFELCHTLS